MEDEGGDRRESLLSGEALIAAVKGSVIGAFPMNWKGFYSVSIDSRGIEEGGLFVPLSGAVNNGHTFITQALERGASAVLIADMEYTEKPDYWKQLAGDWREVLFILTEKTLTALQNAAAAYIDRFPGLLRIAVTGSSGKTTTKDISGSIFSASMPSIMNEGNRNSETGMPLSVFGIREEHRAGIFEMGMDHRGEISALAKVLRPHLALITNIGTAHIGILGSKAAIAEEKKAIFSCFSGDDRGFVPENDDFREFLMKDTAESVSPWGFDSAGIANIRNNGLKGSLFTVDGLEVSFPLPGRFNLRNAAAAVTLARAAGIPAEQIQQGLEAVKPLFGRGEVFDGPVTVIQDCYNSNPDSFENALELCDEIEWRGRRVYILADMRELGPESCAAHERAGELLAFSRGDVIILFGPEMKHAYEVLLNRGGDRGCGGKEVIYTTDIADVIAETVNRIRAGDMVFLKGSRFMELERVTPAILEWNRTYTGDAPGASQRGGG